ncbi:MAG: S8 family peptidase [Bacteroidetes bacterium]|nr:S8 family peptidase [Bacteroidota bacterium]MBS1930146.1 S8 family peptidase [Bacteroidota bacterium]
MKQLLLLFLSAQFIITESAAQFTRYIVKLKDKGNNTFSLANPIAYLSQRAIDRRTRYHIPIDSFDLPVTPSYITQIKNVPNVSILNVSKWLNAVTIQTSDANAITTINAFPFVKNISGIAARGGQRSIGFIDKFSNENLYSEPPVANRLTETESDYYNYGAGSFAEVNLHNAQFLHNVGLRGQGMQIALLDAGFTNYATLRSFDSINANGQILGTWDFVSGNADVNDHNHGMECLSIISANIPGQFIGKAPKASFYLYRTEDAATEYPIEEHNWACGAERADSAGVDVISTSLGYTQFDNATLNHTYADMNGKTTMAAMAATMAARKGLLIFAANGNDGNNSWHYLSTPADADSILSVGAVNTSGFVGSFSSYGPSSDGRVKPDVASVGVNAMIQLPSNSIGTGNGTSFACPNMAGMGTCLWQGFPEFNNMKIIRAIQKAGSIFSTPDDRIGYGIPNLKAAFSSLLVDFATSSATINNCTATLSWTSKDVSAMRYEIERKSPGDTAFIKIADVSPSPGSILSNNNYQYSDALDGIANGIISYRIRQIIDTSVATFTAVYIDTAATSFTSNCSVVTGDKIYTIPNPTSNGQAKLVIETTYEVINMLITIYDMKGSLVQKMTSSKFPGRTIIDLPASRLPKGKYIIKVYNGKKDIGTTSLLSL